MKLKSLFILILLIFLLVSDAAAQEPIGWALPYPISWSLPAPPFDLPLPFVPRTVIERSHAVERHGADAERAREAARDPRRCQDYKCTSSIDPNTFLRICTIPGDKRHVAVQWIFWRDSNFYEGTSFIMRASRRERYLRRRGCRPVEIS